jgi:hypothetical protein
MNEKCHNYIEEKKGSVCVCMTRQKRKDGGTKEEIKQVPRRRKTSVGAELLVPSSLSL